ncbi:hypothetical protein QBC41DRAFT_356204 [Cercophora samala]|uniref:Uncharacterized protein n=1 Tax=Cercophora samala TaxID=330535 RepID=A0AA40DCG8_9PEZI|nr:hypothetical protein QBC41DRAFT_356204 [Cercophora samala]
MVGMTASAAEHRFRGVNAQAKGLRLAYELYENGAGPPPSDYDFTKITSNVWGKGGPQPEDLQKYFGASTEQGLQYHFRAIKQQANVLKDAVDSGEDPVDAFDEYLQNGGHGVRKGVSVRGGSTKAARAAAGAKPSPAKPAATRKRLAAAPSPKTPHKSPTKKQKVKEQGQSPDDLVSPPDQSPPALPQALVSPEVPTSSDVDSPEVNYDALDEEAPKPKANSPWKKMAGQIGGPGQWSDLMSGERAKLKSKNDQVLAQHAANNNAVIDLDSSSPNTPEKLPSLPGGSDSVSPTPTRPQRVKKEGGAHAPSTPAFKFSNIDINDGGDEDEEMGDDEDDGAI